MKKLTILTVIIAPILLMSTTVNAAGKLGLGVIAGEPTGPCFKYWTGAKTAIDGAVAWSTSRNSSMHLHADYLIHNFNLFHLEKGRLPFYFGLGGRIRFAEGTADDHIGIRIPVGIAYLFDNSPFDIFFELVPVLDLAPDTDIAFNGAIGARFFF